MGSWKQKKGILFFYFQKREKNPNEFQKNNQNIKLLVYPGIKFDRHLKFTRHFDKNIKTIRSNTYNQPMFMSKTHDLYNLNSPVQTHGVTKTTENNQYFQNEIIRKIFRGTSMQRHQFGSKFTDC